MLFSDLVFQGISPKLEFSTKTKITETSAPTLDIYDDLLLVRALDVSTFTCIEIIVST